MVAAVYDSDGKHVRHIWLCVFEFSDCRENSYVIAGATKLPLDMIGTGLLKHSNALGIFAHVAIS